LNGHDTDVVVPRSLRLAPSVFDHVTDADNFPSHPSIAKFTWCRVSRFGLSSGRVD
jgi:hypothetical protein